MKIKHVEKERDSRKELIKLIENIGYMHNKFNVWRDFIYLSAIAISQTTNFKKEREEEYLRIINHYDKETQNLFPTMFNELVSAFEKERFADILGDIYSQLGLINKSNGQFFTPYHVCQLMSKITMGNDLKEKVDKQGYITVNDPCCGAGALLIAFAEVCLEEKVNFQNSVLFIAQDIDPLVGLMCYIQMSLLGMPGYVIIGDTFLYPPVFPLPEHYNVWYTPFYLLKGFNYKLRSMIGASENNNILLQEDRIMGTSKKKNKKAIKGSDEMSFEPLKETVSGDIQEDAGEVNDEVTSGITGEVETAINDNGNDEFGEDTFNGENLDLSDYMENEDTGGVEEVIENSVSNDDITESVKDGIEETVEGSLGEFKSDENITNFSGENTNGVEESSEHINERVEDLIIDNMGENAVENTDDIKSAVEDGKGIVNEDTTTLTAFSEEEATNGVDIGKESNVDGSLEGLDSFISEGSSNGNIGNDENKADTLDFTTMDFNSMSKSEAVSAFVGLGESDTVDKDNTVTKDNSRRSNGSGSIYPLKDGKGWGMCIQLGGTPEMKKLYGNKLRIVQTAKTKEQVEAKLADAMANREILLKEKLLKLGYTGN